MPDRHSKSFFGQSTCIIISSNSKYDPFIFLRCIKKKGDNTWEKYSKHEGKVIKLSLEEVIIILEILNCKKVKWSTVHAFKGKKTSIAFNWETNQFEKLWINVEEYPKLLKFAEIEFMRYLLEHMLKEKIEYSTSKRDDTDIKEDHSSEQTISPEGFKIEEQRNGKVHIGEVTVSGNNIPQDNFGSCERRDTKNLNKNKNQKSDDFRKINGTISAETEQALLIQFENGVENWIPKSQMHPSYDIKNKDIQQLLIKDWILERNNI